MEKETLGIENVFKKYTELKKQNASYVVIKAEKNQLGIIFSTNAFNSEQEARESASQIASNYTRPLNKEDFVGYVKHPFFPVPQLLLKAEKTVIAYMKITEFPVYTLSLDIIMNDC
ncbi:MAG: hypothetical protein J6X78_02725 [Treponema sp.]|nr:hypothetical protein [Treponema sp.]